MKKKKLLSILMMAMVIMCIPSLVACGGDDPDEQTEEPVRPDGPDGPDDPSGGECYTEPTNILLMSDGLAFNWKFGTNTKYYYWSFFTQSEYNKMSESEVIRKVVTGNIEDRCQPDNSDFACVYNCHSSTTYVIVTVSFANGDQQGEIVVTPLSTKTANNQPRAAIDDVSYYSDNSNNTYYGWTTKMNTYSKEYYTYAAASPDEFYTYRLMSYEYTPMVAWLLRNEITKNGEDHTTSINVQKSLNWNFNNGRDYFFAAQLRDGTSYLRAFQNVDKYFLLITWATGNNNELSGVFDYGLYNLGKNSTRSGDMNCLQPLPLMKHEGEAQKMNAKQSDFKFIRLD